VSTIRAAAAIAMPFDYVTVVIAAADGSVYNLGRKLNGLFGFNGHYSMHRCENSE
jgi:hypothetical protein